MPIVDKRVREHRRLRDPERHIHSVRAPAHNRREKAVAFETLQEIVDRVKHETQLRSAETAKRIAVTRDGMFRKGSRRSFYEEGLRDCWGTVLRLSKHDGRNSR